MQTHTSRWVHGRACLASTAATSWYRAVWLFCQDRSCAAISTFVHCPTCPTPRPFGKVFWNYAAGWVSGACRSIPAPPRRRLFLNCRASWSGGFVGSTCWTSGMTTSWTASVVSIGEILVARVRLDYRFVGLARHPHVENTWNSWMLRRNDASIVARK